MGPKTILLPLVLALGCCPTIFAEPAGLWHGPHVIIVGVDGLSVDGVSTARVPRLRELMVRSAWTLEARGVLPTLSSPNWASAINGASPARHGITSNGWLRHMVEFRPVCRGEDGKFPTIFGVLRADYLADFFTGKPGPGSISEALAMRLPAIVERNPWTLAHERYNADWIVVQQFGMVVNNFSHLGEAVAELLSPAHYERYRANVAALPNSAVYEIPELLAKVLDGVALAPSVVMQSYRRIDSRGPYGLGKVRPYGYLLAPPDRDRI